MRLPKGRPAWCRCGRERNSIVMTWVDDGEATATLLRLTEINTSLTAEGSSDKVPNTDVVLRTCISSCISTRHSGSARYLSCSTEA